MKKFTQRKWLTKTMTVRRAVAMLAVLALVFVTSRVPTNEAHAASQVIHGSNVGNCAGVPAKSIDTYAPPNKNATGHYDGFDPPHIRYFSVTQQIAQATACYTGLYDRAFGALKFNYWSWVNDCVACTGGTFLGWTGPPQVNFGWDTNQFGSTEYVWRQVTGQFQRCVTKIMCSTKLVTVGQKLTAAGGYTFWGTGI